MKEKKLESKYPGIPDDLVKAAMEIEGREEVLEADSMSIQNFLLARQKYRIVQIPFEMKIGNAVLKKSLPCRLLTREEQNKIFSLQRNMVKLNNKLNNPPKTDKALKKLQKLSEDTLDEVYKFAVDLCLDPEFTFKFLKDNNITIDVPLEIIRGSSASLQDYVTELPKFRGKP